MPPNLPQLLSVTKEGKSAIFNTAGNDDCRNTQGSNNKSNFGSEDVKNSTRILEQNGMIPNIRLMIMLTAKRFYNAIKLSMMLRINSWQERI